MGNNISLLDCSLRDGGYVNNWRWSESKAKSIVHNLSKSGVDVVEVGFLRDIEEYDSDVMLADNIDDLNNFCDEIIGQNTKCVFAAMMMNGGYDDSKLKPYAGTGIGLLRITAHDYDIEEGLALAKRVQDKGYSVSFNPINIMGYDDASLLELVYKVKELHPFQFTIVDTFGSMRKKDLDRMVSIIDHNLDKDIQLGLHLHENMSMSFSLAQAFLEKHLARNICIDGSLMGVGRNPGNLPIELIADFLNENYDKNYDLDYLMDAIQDYVMPIKGKTEWGYMPEYFLSAKYNLHRNYAEFYLDKGTITSREINHILSRITDKKKTAFDKSYAEELYKEYMNQQIDDEQTIEELYRYFREKEVLVIVPGKSIKEYQKEIEDYITDTNPIVMSLNFTPENFKCDYVFCSNNKRYQTMVKHDKNVIVTSNIVPEMQNIRVNYNRLAKAKKQGENALLMLLNLLKILSVKKIILAGADGYEEKKQNYFQENMRSYSEHGNQFNLEVAEAIRNLMLDIRFLTPSRYERSE